MKNLILVGVIAAFLFKTIYSQANIKTWTESTEEDFSDNQLSNLVVTNNQDGKVQFLPPLIKTAEDSYNQPIKRFLARDSAGNYVWAFLQGTNVFVKKYSYDEKELTNLIIVNDTEGTVANDGYCRSALMNDGTFMIIWVGIDINGIYDIYIQLFKNDSVRIGGNIVIKEISDVHQNLFYPVSVMASNYDKTFWIFYQEDNPQGCKINILKIDEFGNKVGDTFLLNQENINQYELRASAAADKDFFWIAWDGANNNVSWVTDVYLRKFNYYGTPLNDAVIVNDVNARGQSQVDICTDKNSNLFVVWTDEKDSKPMQLYGCQYIYGQLFDKDGSRIGINMRLNDTTYLFNQNPDIEYTGSEYQLSYVTLDKTNRPYLTFINKWKYEPQFSGEMVSSIFNAGPSGDTFSKIYWNAVSPPQTELKFKLRSAKTMQQLLNAQWYGPSGTLDFYTDKEGTNINTIHNGDQFIQYKAIFNSENGSTSILDSINIEYSTMDNASPLPPSNLTAGTKSDGIVLNWNPNSEADLLNYFVYSRIEGSSYNELNRAFVPKNKNTFKDTSIIPGKRYLYVVTAVDSSHNQGSYSNEVLSTTYGRNIYISVNGSSSGDGSINNPYQTIQQGSNAAQFGDTIRVYPGTYNDSFTLEAGVSLVGKSAAECNVNAEINAVDSSIIKGFTFSKTITCNNVSPIITENIFSGTNEYQKPAILTSFYSSPSITKNFVNEFQRGIVVETYSNPLIKNNIIYVTEAGIIVGNEEKPTIINNTIISQNEGVLQMYSTLPVIIQNNIVMGLNENAYAFAGNGSSGGILYNLFWNPNHSSFSVPNNNLFHDPNFINFDLQDFHLLNSSPAVNSGNPDPQYKDLDGSRNDMGAYGGQDPIHFGVSIQLTRSIVVSSISGYPGDTVIVPISMDNPAGLLKAEFIFQYDNSLLEFQKAERTETTKDFILTHQVISESEISLSLSSGIASKSGKKEILNLKFLVNKMAGSEDASSLKIKNISWFDASLTQINLRNITDGVFVVNRIEESKFYIYVDKNNSGIQDGSREHPYNSISEAVTKSKSGDTILVDAGTYNEHLEMKDSIYIIGAGASVATINNSDDEVLSFNQVKGSGVSGFTIKSSPYWAAVSIDSSSVAVRKNRFVGSMDLSYGIECNKNSNVIFENNYFKETPIILLNSNAIIKNNLFESSRGNRSISCFDNSSAEISHNSFYGSSSYIGISIQSNSEILVNNNTIDCSDEGWGIIMSMSKHSKIYNNIIKDKSLTGNGILVSNSKECEIINNSILTRKNGIVEIGSGNTILNNIIVNNTFGVSLSSFNCDYNDVWNNLINYNNTFPGANDISVDPLFADTAKENYRLSELSPCINAGSPDPEFNDIDGSRNDIGAFGGPYSDSSWKFENISSLSIDSITAATDTIQIIINGEGVNGTAGIDLGLSYDPSLLEISNASVSNLTKSFSIERRYLKPGSILLSLNSIKGISEENGKLIVLQLALNREKVISTILHFESAIVMDEATCIRQIFNLKDGEINIVTGIDENKETTPANYLLFQNYPNPFNPTTIISYQLPKESKVQLIIYNILGQKVAELVNSFQFAGKYEIRWNAQKFASGVYFYRIQAGSFSQVRKMMLIR